MLAQAAGLGDTSVVVHRWPEKATGQAQATLSQVLTQTSTILGRFPHPLWLASSVALNRSCFQVTSPASP